MNPGGKPPRSGEPAAYAAMTVSMAIVGSSVVVGKLVTSAFPVFLASALRFALASLLLAPALWLREGGFARRLSRREGWALFGVSLTGVFLFNVCMLYGLRWTTAAASGIVTSATPALIVLFSYLLLGERLDARRIAAMVFTVAGIVALGLASGPSSEDSGARARDGTSLAGMALVFGAATGEALYTVLGKGLTRSLSPLAIVTGVSLIGFVLFLPIAAIEAVQFPFADVPASAWLLIAYYAVIVTVAAFMLWYYGVARVAANSAAVFTGIIPVAAVLLSYAVLGERFRWGHVLGITGVLAGIACIAWPRR